MRRPKRKREETLTVKNDDEDNDVREKFDPPYACAIHRMLVAVL